jgi:hypothetical protein
MIFKLKNIRLLTLGVIMLNMVALPDLKAQVKAGDKTSAKAFVQQFYDWYVPLYQKGQLRQRNQVSPAQTALSQKKDYFDNRLFNALSTYYNTPAPKGAEDVLGIDIDPFLSSQDLDFHYTIAGIKQKGANYLANVRCITNKRIAHTAATGEASVIVEVGKIKGRWKLIDFRYDNGSDIFDLITAYNKDVKSTLALKH